ncbi:hypothetical protein [Micromonospora pattaloongensis]|uniref:hypothetical protein n=1 Tax=Micromonospora pattaloongensis TaxID=405436 RepID=UPI00111524B8|nr:hypothetical protein [Micromonospora pattaloongensis]
MIADRHAPRGRLLKAAAITVCLLLCTAGCWAVGGSNLWPVQPSELVGTWEGPSGQRLLLEANGRFAAVKVPSGSDALDGTGRWAVTSLSGGKLVHLHFEEQRFGTSLHIQRRPNLDIRLFEFIGDPDGGQRLYLDRKQVHIDG